MLEMLEIAQVQIVALGVVFLVAAWMFRRRRSVVEVDGAHLALAFRRSKRDSHDEI